MMDVNRAFEVFKDQIWHEKLNVTFSHHSHVWTHINNVIDESCSLLISYSRTCVTKTTFKYCTWYVNSFNLYTCRQKTAESVDRIFLWLFKVLTLCNYIASVVMHGIGLLYSQISLILWPPSIKYHHTVFKKYKSHTPFWIGRTASDAGHRLLSELS